MKSLPVDATAGGTEPWLRERVRRYYDTTQVLYSWIWSPTGIHYGFWGPGTYSRNDAIHATDRCAGREFGLPAGSRILDAGCGIGGTSILLAEEFDYRVLGITLSGVQLARAQRAAAMSRATERPAFEIRDFLATGLESGSFDGVLALESLGHADDKTAFLQEAFRLLRPGGRLVVFDGFLAGELSGDHEFHYRRFLEGLECPRLARIDDFLAALGECGFTEVRSTDKQREIQPSVRAIWRLSRMGVAVCRLPCALGLWPESWIRHGQAGISQKPLFEDGALVYRVCSATKPA